MLSVKKERRIFYSFHSLILCYLSAFFAFLRRKKINSICFFPRKERQEEKEGEKGRLGFEQMQDNLELNFADVTC